MFLIILHLQLADLADNTALRHLTTYEVHSNIIVTLLWPKCNLRPCVRDASSLACYAQIQFGAVPHIRVLTPFHLASAHTSRHTLVIVAGWSLRDLYVASVTVSLTHVRDLWPHH